MKLEQRRAEQSRGSSSCVLRCDPALEFCLVVEVAVVEVEVVVAAAAAFVISRAAVEGDSNRSRLS